MQKMWETQHFILCNVIAGSTLYKCLNRVFGTFLAGFIAIGVHWIAIQSGEKLGPFIVGFSVFVLGM